MHTAKPSLLMRDDTFFGVCEALGEDFRFNPLLLRLAFGVSLLWDPAVVLGCYLALGLVVAASRWLFPAPKADAQQAAPVEHVAAQAGNDAHVPELAQAA